MQRVCPDGATAPRYRARFSRAACDIAAAQDLRALAFATDGPDGDDFDDLCTHLLIEDSDGALVCCARLLLLADGAAAGASYSAQFYDLTAFAKFPGAMVEIGRFCIHPARADGDILRVAWAAMTGFVDAHDIEMLFGCSSFSGTESDVYRDTFAMLKARYIAPARWLPRIKSPEVIPYAFGKSRVPDLKQALKAMPPLLRTYLMMGGWVSDHAVVDRGMNTLHVFTGLEVRAIPEIRKRMLRRMALDI
ncbi:MAG: GNAT family N-acetyltransferase [Rhodobacteraceae bacterium]|nr:GNAT family N-acetyltransferase [Paracoccaceae bacterium]